MGCDYDGDLDAARRAKLGVELRLQGEARTRERRARGLVLALLSVVPQATLSELHDLLSGCEVYGSAIARAVNAMLVTGRLERAASHAYRLSSPPKLEGKQIWLIKRTLRARKRAKQRLARVDRVLTIQLDSIVHNL